MTVTVARDAGCGADSESLAGYTEAAGPGPVAARGPGPAARSRRGPGHAERHEFAGVTSPRLSQFQVRFTAGVTDRQ